MGLSAPLGTRAVARVAHRPDLPEAPLLWRADKLWRTFWPEIPWVKEKPSAYVEAHFHFTTAPAHLGDATPSQILELVEMIGPSRLLYASDYPHNHGRSGERLLDALDDGAASAVLHANAARLYGLNGE